MAPVSTREISQQQAAVGPLSGLTQPWPLNNEPPE
jgi:hypothetical protein